MAEQSGFFDAHLVDGEYDRIYLAEHFAKYFASFIGNGIFGGKSNELMVREKETPSMSVRVLSGQAWIDGYWYENDDEHFLTIDIADGVLHRIDSIVVRWNHSERIIRLAVKKGVAATSPVAPIVQRDDDYYELKLADIYIKAGTTNITQSSITDKRYHTDECGLVIGVVQQLDAEEFGIQLDAYIAEFIAEHDAWKSTTVSDIEAWAADMKTSYNNWYATFKADSQTTFDQFMQTNQTNVDNFISAKQTEIANMVAAGNTSINNVVSTGTANINKLISDKTTEINTLIEDSENRVDEVVNAGNTNINNVVTTGQQNINKVVSDGTTNINKVVSDGTTKIDNLVTSKTKEIDDLVTEKTTEMDNVISSGQQRFDDVIGDLEEVAANNDIASIVLDVNNLKTDNTANKKAIEELKVKVEEPNGMGIEDETEVGCYYVEAADGSKEWINPPNKPGIEYRTTERWNGSPVYQRVLYSGALSNKAVMSIEIEAEYDKIISVAGFAYDPENIMSYPFPIILNGLTPIAVISGIEGNGDVSYIIINVNEDLTAFSGYFTVKYTK